jgi:hypothetical protein
MGRSFLGAVEHQPGMTTAFRLAFFFHALLTNHRATRNIST